MNMSKWDRIIRAVIGIGALAFLPVTVWALLGLIPLATAVTGFCPLYRLIGCSTRPAKPV